MMRARIGDWLIIPPPPHGHHERRRGQITEVAHADGSPPYVVRWLDDEHVSMVFPPRDAEVRPATPHRADTT